MRRVIRMLDFSNQTILSLFLRFASVVGILLFGAPLVGQTPSSITNLAQLTQAAASQQQVVSGLHLNAVVFACDTNSGVLVLADASGAELLELDGLSTEFQPGDQIEIGGKQLLFSASDVGIFVSVAPLLNDDGAHPPKSVSGEFWLAEGRHAVRLDWFNQVALEELAVSCVPAQREGIKSSSIAPESNLLHAVSAECYEGFWVKLPNFQLLRPVKVASVTNFDVQCQTRPEMAGIRFSGYIDVPADGRYAFQLRSDDGSRLWVGNTEVAVKKIGAVMPPAAPQAMPATGKDVRRLATISGRVGFATRTGKGMRLDLHTEQGTINVVVANSGSLEPAELLNVTVRASGVAGSVLTVAQRPVLGTLSVATSSELTVIEKAPGKDHPPAVLKTVAQVHSLSRNEAALGLPVDIQGTATAVAQATEHWMVIQDDTRGTFVQLDSVADCRPNVGELWRVIGRTRAGGFAPVVAAEKAVLLGKGRVPEAAHPAWSQLANGNMDAQWVELDGVVVSVSISGLSLLMPEGRLAIDMPGWGGAELKSIDKARVRIRGALFAVWDAATRESKVGNIAMHNASVAVEESAPKNPFDAPEKTARGLFGFDASATPLQRVKVLGQVTYADFKRVILDSDAGVEVYPSVHTDLKVGDMAEAVGYPAQSDAGPQLREAVLRKTSDGVLSAAPRFSIFPSEKLALKRIQVEGTLVGKRAEGNALVLQVQANSQLFAAYATNDASLYELRVGSKLLVTGVNISSAYKGIPSLEASHFDLLVNAPGDIAVLSAPSWWTLRKLMTVVGVLVTVLVFVSTWTLVLRRQVAQRTVRLQHEVRERENAERLSVLEAERSRIARDLHDELGSGLTEMGLLASAGLEEQKSLRQNSERYRKIAERSRALVSGLDVIVWAIDPRQNSLQSFADYVEHYAEELLSSSSIHCRFKIPVECKAVSLTGTTRHSLVLAVKEALSNVIRHSAAREVELRLAQTDAQLEIRVSDNGRGFDFQAIRPGDGLKNLRERMNALGGGCQVESLVGKGTTVIFTVPLCNAHAGKSQEKMTV